MEDPLAGVETRIGMETDQKIRAVFSGHSRSCFKGIK